MAAAKVALETGDPSELERILVGRRIWVETEDLARKDDNGHPYTIKAHCYDVRVLSFHQFLPADRAAHREKHLVQLWTDPGGMRVLSVGSIRFQDPGKVRAGQAAAAKRDAASSA